MQLTHTKAIRAETSAQSSTSFHTREMICENPRRFATLAKCNVLNVFVKVLFFPVDVLCLYIDFYHMNIFCCAACLFALDNCVIPN